MRNSIKVAISLSLLVSCGCAAPLIITPATAVVGAMTGGQVAGMVMPDDTYIAVDEASLDRRLRETLQTAEKWSVIGADDLAGYAARRVEDGRGVEVYLEPASSALSNTQRRRMAKNVCDGSNQPDVVLSFTSEESDAGAGTLVKGLFTGKVSTQTPGVIHVRRCDDGWESDIDITLHVKEGIYTSTEAEITRNIGEAFGSAMLEIVGSGTVASSESNVSESGGGLVEAIQSSLAKRGYYKGKVDGLFGPNTKMAISDYQADSGMKVTGEASSALLQHLEQHKP
jgi:hypothetical protein